MGSLIATMNEGICLHEIVEDESGQAVDYRIIDVNKAYETIRDELAKYSEELADKPEIIALNKTDLISAKEAARVTASMPGEVFLISAVTGKGIDSLLEAAWKVVAEVRGKDSV